MTIHIRPFRADRDARALSGLWNTNLGTDWPVSPGVLARATWAHGSYGEGDLLVAVSSEAVVGFVSTHPEWGGTGGHLSLLLVDSQHRRRGIGTALHNAVLGHLREAGARSIALGGGGEYLWPGVPLALPDALSFFHPRGWRFTHECHDLTQRLAGCTTPAAVRERGQAAGGVVAPGAEADGPQILAFVAREFPEWLPYYTRVVDLGDYDDVLLARDTIGTILGVLMLYGAWSHPERNDVRWKTLLGQDAGALGVVGVAEAARRKGIGTALVARASEILREHGAGTGFVGWVWAVEFYARLGYRSWRSYAMGEREP
jgi:ribosomal protein S18 acetylase RimI-like enzyme